MASPLNHPNIHKSNLQLTFSFFPYTKTHRKSLMTKCELDFLDVGQLIGGLKGLCRIKQRVRISPVEDMFFRKLQHEIHKCESMKELIPSLRHGQFIFPIVSCTRKPPFFVCIFFSLFNSWPGTEPGASTPKPVLFTIV